MNAETGTGGDTRGADFTPLPVDGRAPLEGRVRVCIVTEELTGLYPCGGIGTAYTTLAETLAHAGNEVTVLYVPGVDCGEQPVEPWVRHYGERGIQLVLLPGAGLRVRATPYGRRSYEVYLWLRDRMQQFDVIHFPECRGLGYYALLAKHQGLAFDDICMCVETHSPFLWVREAQGWRLREVDDLAMCFQERRCVELADVVVSPSRYMLGWMQRQGWQLPPETFVQPYILPRTARLEGVGVDAPAADNERSDVAEFVFFGRLEDRKGLVPFCDALDILAASGATGFTVTFLGRPHVVQGEKAADYLARRGRDWPFPWQRSTSAGPLGWP
ncbi:MAG: glycosyltransferase [Planctomycetota bacterium]|jgi:glycosyltransferase involved in cell wall biosynthesis